MAAHGPVPGVCCPGAAVHGGGCARRPAVVAPSERPRVLVRFTVAEAAQLNALVPRGAASGTRAGWEDAVRCYNAWALQNGHCRRTFNSLRNR